MPQFLQQLPGDPDGLVDGLNHVNRNTDGACLIGDGSRDGLTNPPGGIGRELVALGIVKLLHGFNETEVSFLDQIQEQHAAPDITLGNGNDKTEVCFRHAAFRFFIAFRHAFCQIQFLLRSQQGNLSDLLEIHAHRIIRGKAVQQCVGIGYLFGGNLFDLTEIVQLRQQIVIQNRHQVAACIVDVNAGLLQLLIELVNRFCIQVQLIQQIQVLGGKLPGFLAFVKELLQPNLGRPGIDRTLFLAGRLFPALDEFCLLLAGDIRAGCFLDELIGHALEIFFGQLQFVIHGWYPFRSLSLSRRALRSSSLPPVSSSCCSRIFTI